MTCLPQYRMQNFLLGCGAIVSDSRPSPRDHSHSMIARAPQALSGVASRIGAPLDTVIDTVIRR